MKKKKKVDGTPAWKIDWSGDEFEFPPIEQFIAEYNVLCAKHKMGLSAYGTGSDYSDYSCDGGLTLEPWPVCCLKANDLDLTEAGNGIECIDAALADVARKRADEDARQERQQKEANEKARRTREAATIKNGIIVAGKRYKLVPDEGRS